MAQSQRRNRFYPTLKDQPDVFWAKVAIGEPGECWPWIGCLSTRGYGRAGKKGYAHRLAYELANGVDLQGEFICHSCDNPPCCNPAHLFLGDAGANARDMARKGRVGGGQPFLVDPQEARRLHAMGWSFRKIGRHVGHSHAAVANAIRRRP